MGERDRGEDAVTRPVITIDPAVRFGAPSVAGIPATALAGCVLASDSVTATADENGEIAEATDDATDYERYGRDEF